MKTKIQKFKPNLENLMLMDSVLRRAVRQGYLSRNKGVLPTYNQWRRDDLRDTIKAYRMIVNTEVCHAQ